MPDRTSRRKYLLSMSAVTMAGVSGCSQLITREETTTTETTADDLENAEFNFRYNPQNNEITIQFDGGARIRAENLMIRSEGDKRVRWPELGSTLSEPDDQISPDETAVIGENVLNWERAIEVDTTIWLVYVGHETPTTLSRYSPPDGTTVTTTVPSTESTTTAVDSEPPSITGFSLANPHDQRLRVAFDSTGLLTRIHVDISGPEEVSLKRPDFSVVDTNDGQYTYEANYDTSSDGRYTAILNEAVDENGNDGSDGQTVSIAVESSPSKSIWEDFEEYPSDTTPEGWTGDLDDWSADSSVTAPSSNTSGKLVFGGHSRVEYEFEKRKQPSHIFFWMKSDQYDDQGLHINLIGEGGSRFVKMMTGRRGKPGDSCYNCPAITTNIGTTTTNERATVLTTSPLNGEWYFVNIYDIDWESQIYSIELLDSDEQTVADEQGLDFFESAGEFAKFSLANRMNGTESVAWVDNIGNSAE